MAGDLPFADSRLGPFPELSNRERAKSMAETLAGRSSGPIYVFAYGSLLWRPSFEPASRLRARIEGYQRRFAMWTVKARGTPERPGLGLGLEAGDGGCAGVLLEVPRDDLQHHLARLWEREMLTGVYEPVWLEAVIAEPALGDGGEQRLSAGSRLPAIAFVLRSDHPQYAGDLTPEQAAGHIAFAHGELGSCIDYLRKTVEALATAGFPDPILERLLSLSVAMRSLDQGRK